MSLYDLDGGMGAGREVDRKPLSLGDSTLATVEGAHQNGKSVFVRMGTGGVTVQLSPGSVVPRVGQDVLIVGTRRGLMAVNPRNTLLFWNFEAILPYNPPNKLTGPPMKITEWILESDVPGNLALDIRAGSRTGPSIVGATPPTLTAPQFLNADVIDDDSDWVRRVGHGASRVSLYFVPLEVPVPTVGQYNILLIGEAI